MSFQHPQSTNDLPPAYEAIASAAPTSYPLTSASGYPPAGPGRAPAQQANRTGGYPLSNPQYAPSGQPNDVQRGFNYQSVVAGAAVGAAIGAAGSYSSYQAQPSQAVTGTPMAPSSREDPLDLLCAFDTAILVDDSGSMLSASGNTTRWHEARDALAGLAALVASKDPDGIDVFFLNAEAQLCNCTDPNAVRSLFDSITPRGATPTAARLEDLTSSYLDTIEYVKLQRRSGTLPPGTKDPRKRNYLVITDGAPTDDLEEVLFTIAQRLDQNHFPLSQLGFSFIQVGDDPEAGAFLRELDDSLSTPENPVRDMVDTTPYSGMALGYDAIVKCLLGGINRRFDKLPNHPA